MFGCRAVHVKADHVGLHPLTQDLVARLLALVIGFESRKGILWFLFDRRLFRFRCGTLLCRLGLFLLLFDSAIGTKSPIGLAQKVQQNFDSVIFVHGLPIYSVSIALLREGWPVLGVVYEAGMDECFTAYEGGGAFLNGKRISTTTSERLEDTLLATGFPYYNFSKLQGFQDTLAHMYQHTRGVRRIGTAAVDLAYTACGRFDGYFEYGLSPWDVAAGVVLVREAGGIVTDFSNNNVPVASESIIAANKSIHPLVYTIIEQKIG